VVGYDIDIVKAILKKHQITPVFKTLHWNRCLLEAKRGSNIHVVMSATATPIRESTYLLTKPYYEVTLTYFYLRDNYPQRVLINQPSDLLKEGKVCARLGYSYFNFGLNPADIDKNQINIHNLVNMLLRGRCINILVRLEAFAGTALVGKNYLLNKKISYQLLPKVSNENMYMLISRKYQYAQQLKTLLNQGFAELKKSGESRALLQHYIDLENLNPRSLSQKVASDDF
jgi:polar amino acid transport system substrate-binding protein